MRRDHPLAAEIADAAALPFTAHEIVATLEPLLTDARRARIDAVIAQRTRAVIPVLDGLIDPHNVAAVLRSADSFGVQEVHLIDAADQPYLASQRVTQGADRWLDIAKHATAERCVLVTASPRKVPACRCGSTLTGSLNTMVTCPPIRSATASAVPR